MVVVLGIVIVVVVAVSRTTTVDYLLNANDKELFYPVSCTLLVSSLILMTTMYRNPEQRIHTLIRQSFSIQGWGSVDEFFLPEVRETFAT